MRGGEAASQSKESLAGHSRTGFCSDFRIKGFLWLLGGEENIHQTWEEAGRTVGGYHGNLGERRWGEVRSGERWSDAGKAVNGEPREFPDRL